MSHDDGRPAASSLTAPPSLTAEQVEAIDHLLLSRLSFLRLAALDEGEGWGIWLRLDGTYFDENIVTSRQEMLEYYERLINLALGEGGPMHTPPT